MDRPAVVVHTAVSLDGATTGFAPDVERFYALAATFGEDVTLCGADTILAQEEALASVPRPGPTEGAPLLAVVDGRSRVSAWDALRDCGHWSGVVPLRAAPGSARVDLGAALGMLRSRFGARVVRVDSGGALTGALLRAGLVDEVSLLVHPVLVGGVAARAWHGGAGVAGTLELLACDTFDGLVWLRHRVVREG